MEDGQNHALAKISGCMQLGNTYAMLGQIENSILCYTAGLEIQRQVLGETNPQVGETCRYVAEAHVQALEKKYGPPHPDCTGQVRTLFFFPQLYNFLPQILNEFKHLINHICPLLLFWFI